MSEIKTNSGIMIDPLRPRQELIKIEDIAHSLSMLCRANGHFKSFYSVCQHSINCMQEARARGYSRRVQLACLLHDGSEAYLSDVTRPVKEELPLYRKIEEPLQEMIWQKWLGSALTEEEDRQVFAIDDAILYHEFVALMDGTRLWEPEPKLCAQPVFAFTGFSESKQEFLRLFQELTE